MRSRAPLLLAVLLLTARSAGAQEPDSAADRRTPAPPPTAQDSARAAGDTASQDTVPAPAAAPFVYPAPRVAVRVGFGRPGFGTLQSQPARVQRLDAAGAVLEEQVVGRSLQLDGGIEVTASAVASLNRRWAVRLGGSWTRATLASDYTGDTTWTALAEEAAPRQELETTSLGAEAALRLRLPSSRRVQPFLELGGLLMRWSTDGNEPGADALGEGVTRLGGLAALGAVVPIGNRVALQLQATQRVFRTPVDAPRRSLPGPTTRPLIGVRAGGPSVALTYEPVESTAWADTGHTLTSALRLEVGVSLGFGAAAPAPVDPAEPAASTPPPAR